MEYMHLMTRKMTMSENMEFPTEFLAEYAATLLKSGATTVRTEKNVCRIAGAYGLEAEVNIYPRHVEVVLRNGDNGKTVVRSKAICDWGINYSTVTALSKLSWNCHDRHPVTEAITRQYRRVIHSKNIPPYGVNILTSLANAAFCRLFGGDGISMAIVFAATACGFYVKTALHEKWHIDTRAAVFIAGFVSAILSCSGYVFNLGTTPDVALATAVLYLVPGIHYLNAASDMINRHYICAVSRFIHAGVITICLSAGLYVAMMLMNIGMIQK